MWRVVWKIAVILAAVMGVYYFMNDAAIENEPLESPIQPGSPATMEKGEWAEGGVMPRPDAGLSMYVGGSAEKLLEEFGEPDRKEPSNFQYEWWVYTSGPRLMAGVQKGKVNQVYTANPETDAAPFQIGQAIEEIHRFAPIESEIDVAINSNIYTFSLNSEDIQNRILIPYQDVFAQLYVDAVDGQLEGVRFISPSTLVKHQPYDMTYLGEIIESPKPSSAVQTEVDRAMERQVLELTNKLRAEHQIPMLAEDEKLAELSREHSEAMIFQKYSSHNDEPVALYSERLKAAGIDTAKAAENTALNYVDAIETVHGWLNSPKHRSVLLNPAFTHSGAGVYNKYYTQSFIAREMPAD